MIWRPTFLAAAWFAVVLVTMAAAQTTKPEGTGPCDQCRQYCEKMKKKTKMQDLILCDNEGVTWKNNCDFIHRQVWRKYGVVKKNLTIKVEEKMYLKVKLTL